MACHISRSCCSAPVAFAQEGCFGVPAQPAARKQSPTTEHTKDHGENFCRFLVLIKHGISGSQLNEEHNKKAQRIDSLCPSCFFCNTAVVLISENLFLLLLRSFCLLSCGSNRAQGNEP